MLDEWGHMLAAVRHAMNSNREEHSVTKGYGAQTRRQHSKAMSQKALSICGKILFHLYGDSQVSRSEFNEYRRSINGSDDEINSQQSLFPGRDRPFEEDNLSHQIKG